MELAFPVRKQEGPVKSNFAPILASLIALAIGQSPGSGSAELPDAVAKATGDSLPERAITILLPELEEKATAADGGSGAFDLYRAVSVARGYLQLGLYEEAAGWYERLEGLDTQGLFRESILDGKLTIAASRGDVDSLSVLLARFGGAARETGGDALLRIFARLGNDGHWDLLATLIGDNMALFGDRPPADLLYLKGRALRRGGRLAEAVFHFESQLNALKVPAAVHPSLVEQAPRFLQAAADCSFLINDRLRARQLYQQLLQAKAPGYAAWGLFQIANLNMLSNAYAKAEEDYRAVAADSTGGALQAWAEDLAKHCAGMSAHRKYYITINPQSMAALP